MQLGEGALFAGYTIVRALGAGGMGEVYLAQHPRLPRQDALKILGPQVSSSPTYRERFLREAEQAARLSHPNIVTVFDRGEDQGRLWIAMAYVDGEDAGRLLARRWPAGIPIELVTATVVAVASALDFAHRQGVLHRDVKPSNILMTDPESPRDRQILLADFGIARDLDEPDGLTTTNTTLGTVAYAAPEQLMGERIDGRADQYALAATAYQLLTGRAVFPQTNPAVVISHHLNSPPPALAATRADLAALDPVLAAALAKDPRGRFASCQDFAHAFAEQARTAAPIPAAAPTAPAPHPPVPPPTPTATPAAAAARRSRRGPAAIGTAAILAVAAGGGWLWWDNQAADRQPASAAPTPTGRSTPSKPPPVVTAPALDGTYRMQEIGDASKVSWVGFRDACTAEGCIATSAHLDPKNLSAPADIALTEIWHWTGDIWQSTGVQQEWTCNGPEGESAQTRTVKQDLSPSGDGNYRLTIEIATISDECGDEGATYTSKYKVTRTGPAPVGVVEDPPTSLIGQLPPPLPQTTKTPAPKSVQVRLDGQPFVSGEPFCWWLEDGELDVTVRDSSGDIAMTVDGISAAGAGSVTIWTDNTAFHDFGGRSVSVTQTGRSSFAVNGVADDVITNTAKTFEMDVTC